ncbi:MAG TPA: YceI family protein, partial [Bacteroidota bacterium]|nr:YceI family protein [Bacteroidota bacterium]
MKSGFVIAAVLLFFRTNSVPQSKVLQSITDSTSVTYTLHHPLHKIEATSKEATISAEVDTVSKEIKSVTAKVDVMSFDSGNSNRDSHAMEVVDALSFPEVSFISTAIDTAGDSIKVTGALTFHGVSK